MTDRERWDALALEKGPMRAAWDDDSDGVEACLEQIRPILPKRGTFLDIGCGPGRLTEPIAAEHPQATVVGLDVSPRMLKASHDNINYWLIDGMIVPEVTSGYHAAWSVLCFQHLKRQQVFEYISTVAENLVPGSAFRFQFVEDGDQAAFPVPLMKAWCKSVGFPVVTVDEGSVFPEWVWITARR